MESDMQQNTNKGQGMERDRHLPIFNQNWTNEDGNHDGGVSFGPGFMIGWQRGSLNENGRNGAFILDVLHAALDQLKYFQDGKFNCPENETALHHLNLAIAALELRRDRRSVQGTLGTTQV